MGFEKRDGQKRDVVNVIDPVRRFLQEIAIRFINRSIVVLKTENLECNVLKGTIVLDGEYLFRQ
jgi:hypothetical protein